MKFPSCSEISYLSVLVAAVLITQHGALAQDKPESKPDGKRDAEARSSSAPASQPDSETEGSITIGGQAIAYKAVAGILTVGSTDVQDATIGLQLITGGELALQRTPLHADRRHDLPL